MISTDSQALECDLLETYGIINMYELPMYRVALFSYGLREDSRIKKAIAGQKADTDTLILALIYDRLGKLLNTKDSNELPSLFNMLTGAVESDVESFDDEESFDREYKKRIEMLRKQ